MLEVSLYIHQVFVSLRKTLSHSSIVYTGQLAMSQDGATCASSHPTVNTDSILTANQSTKWKRQNSSSPLTSHAYSHLRKSYSIQFQRISSFLASLSKINLSDISSNLARPQQQSPASSTTRPNIITKPKFTFVRSTKTNWAHRHRP